MNYQLNFPAFSGLIALPAAVTEHLPEASGLAVKVLIALLSAQGGKPTPEEIASTLGVSAEDARDGLKYWVSKGILTTEEKEKREAVKLVKPGSNTITSKELADQMEHNAQVRCLFESAETLYARPLSAMERRTLLYALQSTLLPVDVILMIIDFCLRIGKASVNYILRVCEDWAEQEINTHELAEERIRRDLEKNEGEKLVMSCFGIHGRKLTKKESDYINKWLHQYGFQLNMVRLAYERTIDSIGELSFPYINKILTEWHKHGIATPEQANSKDAKPAGKQEEKQPSYDLDKLSKRGLYIPEV